MSQVATVEERLFALERDMMVVKREVDRRRGKSDWLKRVAGSHRGDPVFAEIIRLGREYRESQRCNEGEND